MSARQVVVKQHEYYDSVRLMQVSEKTRQTPGVQESIVLMATENNKRLLDSAGLLTPEAVRASPNDLVIAVVADDQAIADQVLRQAETLLKEKIAASADFVYRTMDSALNEMPDANLALISVPGEYAAAEARRALERGLDVLLFSDNVALEDEVALKQLARDNGLVMMGPGCGTAMINGVGLGFANAVRQGLIGIVGASGTGIQEISILIHRYGSGVSHAIGTGGRDLSAAVGGITMLEGIDLLEDDDATKAIVLTSKPPDRQVAETILQRVSKCRKPVVVNFLGGDPETVKRAGALAAVTLEDAAIAAVRAVQKDKPLERTAMDIDQLAKQESAKLAAQQKYIRGLFSGGTLCYEALLILQSRLGGIYSNIPLQPEFGLQDSWQSVQHTLVDLGDETFTVGRAHPMIDPALRLQRLLKEADDPTVAVLLLDVVLGYGSHPDPAASLANAIAQAKEKAMQSARYLSIVASVCGTDDDLQNLAAQEKLLRDAGACVAPSNAQASELAGRIAQLAMERSQG